MTFSTDQPVEDQPITVTGHFNDPDGVQEDTITYTWQYGDDEGEFTPSVNGVGPTFTPGDPEAGWALRVIATFLDGDGNQETITSHTTLPVQNINDAATAPTVTPSNPFVGAELTATEPTDEDGTHNDDGDLLVNFRYQWQRGNTSGEAAGFTDIPGATQATYTATAADAGRRLRVRVRFTDVKETAEEVFSTPTQAVTAAPVPPAAPTAASAAVVNQGSVRVSWAPPADTGGGALTGFEVRVLRDGQVARTVDAISPEDNFVELTVQPGASWSFQVRALTMAGASPWSAASDAVKVSGPPAPPGPPATEAPKNRAATGAPKVRVGGGKAAVFASRGTVADADKVRSLSWTWQRRRASGKWANVRSGSKLVVTDALRGATVRVVARFTDGAGFKESRVSKAVRVPRVKPGRPVVRRVVSGTPGGKATFKVAWKAPKTTGGAPVKRYRLQVVRNGKVVRSFVVGPARRNAVITVQRGTYRVKLTAANRIGRSGVVTSAKVVAR